MKKALILGVGSAQIDIIQYLKQAGWWVIGCAHLGEGRGPAIVDQFKLVDIKNLAGLEQLGAREKVSLVYSVGSDLAMPSVAFVANNLRLPCLVNFTTTNLLQNKLKLREFLTAHNLNDVKYQKITTLTNLITWNNFPAVVKPVDSQGQRGVFMVNSMAELEEKLPVSLDYSKTKTAIVEEFLAGPEISVNAFVINKKVVLNLVSDRLVVEGYPSGIPQAHFFPSQNCIGNNLLETQKLVEQCINRLGIENGPVYFQLKLTKQGPRVIEITPRLDGCHLWRLIKVATNVDMLEASVKLLLGDKSINLNFASVKGSYQLRFLLGLPGNIFNQADYSIPDQVEYLEYYYVDGETVNPINGLLEKVGYYIERVY